MSVCACVRLHVHFSFVLPMLPSGPLGSARPLVSLSSVMDPSPDVGKPSWPELAVREARGMRLGRFEVRVSICVSRAKLFANRVARCFVHCCLLGFEAKLFSTLSIMHAVDPVALKASRSALMRSCLVPSFVLLNAGDRLQSALVFPVLVIPH